MSLSSDQMNDMDNAYRLGANSFLVQPCDFDGLVRLAKLIREFWLTHSEIPESFRSPRTAPTHPSLRMNISG